MTAQTFTARGVVEGMSCQHCVTSVTEEVNALPGVRAVRVDLLSGTVSLTSSLPIEPSALRRAVADAGYRLAPPVGG